MDEPWQSCEESGLFCQKTGDAPGEGAGGFCVCFVPNGAHAWKRRGSLPGRRSVRRFGFDFFLGAGFAVRRPRALQGLQASIDGPKGPALFSPQAHAATRCGHSFLRLYGRWACDGCGFIQDRENSALCAPPMPRAAFVRFRASGADLADAFAGDKRRRRAGRICASKKAGRQGLLFGLKKITAKSGAGRP